MNKKLLYLAVTLSGFSTAFAGTEWLPASPISVISGEDTLETTPIGINDLRRQIAFTNSDLVGVKFEAFGQNLGIHVGTQPGDTFAPNSTSWTDDPNNYTQTGIRLGLSDFNMLDQEFGIHWGISTLDFGDIAISVENSKNNLTDIYAGSIGTGSSTGTFTGADANTVSENPTAYLFNFDIPNSGTYSTSTGGVTNAIDVSKNEREVKASQYRIATGFRLRDIPIETRVGFTLPFYTTSGNFESVESETDTGGNTLDRYTQDYSESVGRTGGIIFDVWTRYRLNDDIRIMASLFSQTDEITGEYDASLTEAIDNDTNDAALDTNQTWTYSETQDTEYSVLRAAIGVEYQQSFNQGGVMLMSWLTYESESERLKQSLDANTYTDALNSANNAAVATGTYGQNSSVEGVLYQLPVSARLHYSPSEKWTYYFAANATLLEIGTETEKEKFYVVNGANTGYNVDYETTQSDEFAMMKADSTTLDIGAQHTILPNITGEYIFSTDATLDNWQVNWGFSASF